MLTLHDVPDLPVADLQPPTVAEAGDPFAELRIVHLVARIDRAASPFGSGTSSTV